MSTLKQIEENLNAIMRDIESHEKAASAKKKLPIANGGTGKPGHGNIVVRDERLYVQDQDGSLVQVAGVRQGKKTYGTLREAFADMENSPVTPDSSDPRVDAPKKCLRTHKVAEMDLRLKALLDEPQINNIAVDVGTSTLTSHSVNGHMLTHPKHNTVIRKIGN